MGKYHRVERQEQQVQDEHLYEELKRLGKENVRLKDEREILKNCFVAFAASLVSRETLWWGIVALGEEWPSAYWWDVLPR